MAHLIEAGDGQCCECEERPADDPCSCGDCPAGAIVPVWDVPNDRGWETYVGNLRSSGGAPAPTWLTLECRTRGGTAELCGYDELVPSAPPRKYRRKIVTTDVTWTCTGGGCTEGCRRGAIVTQVWGDTTCVEGGQSWEPIAPGVELSDALCPGNHSIQEETAVLRREVWSAPGLWGGITCCALSAYMVDALSARDTELHDEDTEAQAITRLLAGAGGTWGGWTGIGDTPGLCAAATCCRAAYEARGAGWTFDYRQAQWRVMTGGAGTVKDGCYRLVVSIYRRAPGGAGWVEWAGQPVDVLVAGGVVALMTNPLTGA